MPKQQQIAHQTYAVAVPPVEGVDPSVLAQVAQLSIQAAAAVAAKNYMGAFVIALQIAGLLAASIPQPQPKPGPLPTPVPIPPPSPAPVAATPHP